MTTGEPRERQRTECPVCGAAYGSPSTACTSEYRGYGRCATGGGSWTTFAIGGATVGPTFIDGDLETINSGHRLLNDAGPDEQWTEVHWVLHEAVAALERIRAALTDLTLDAWAAVPDTEAEGRYNGHLFGEAMGLSGAAAYANLPPSVWASPQRQPLVELRRISNAERVAKP